MSKVTIWWEDKGLATSPEGLKIRAIYKDCTPPMIANLDKKMPDPKHPGKLKDDSGLTGGVTAAHFYHRTSDGHVYVPYIHTKLDIPLFWHWVTCATVQDPAAVVFAMLIIMCSKIKSSQYNTYAHDFMVKYGMSTGGSYDNAVARAWSAQIQAKMQADPTYTSMTGFDVIQTLAPPPVKGRSGVGQVGGGRMTHSRANSGKHLTIGFVLGSIVLVFMLCLAFGHIFVWEATSLVLSKALPGGVYTSMSAFEGNLTMQLVDLLVYEWPVITHGERRLMTPTTPFKRFRDISTQLDSAKRVTKLGFRNGSADDFISVNANSFHDVVRYEGLLTANQWDTQSARQCTSELKAKLQSMDAACEYQCHVVSVDTSTLKTVCSKILKGGSDAMMQVHTCMVALWSIMSFAVKSKPTQEEAALEASKLTFGYVFSLWTGENVVRTFFERILLHSPFLVTASEESFLKNMLMLAWCHENPGMLCLVCTVTLVVFWHTVVFTTIHSTTFKDITVGSASFFKCTANSWYHTDLFKNKKGAIVTHKETQARACIFFVYLVYFLLMSLVKSMSAYAATWNALCHIVLVPAVGLFMTVFFMTGVGLISSCVHGSLKDAHQSVTGALKVLVQAANSLKDTCSLVSQCVGAVVMAGQGLSGIVSPSIDVFFYAHYCGLWCNALLALHVGIDSAVTVFTRAMSAYVAYQTCLCFANAVVVLACGAAVCYVRTQCGYKGVNGALHAEGNNLIVFTCMTALVVVVVRALLGAVLSRQTVLVVTFRAYDMLIGGFVVQLGCGEVLAQWVLSMVLQWQ